MRVSLDHFVENADAVSDHALAEPVHIARGDHDELVLISLEAYRRLQRGERRVVLTTDLTAEELKAIERAQVPDEYRYLDKLLEEDA